MTPFPAVREERTGWRDAQISRRHRKWGFNCPAVDLDFVMVEYNLGLPVGLIEYKHEGAAMPNLEHATYRALIDLSDNYKGSGLPFFIAFYNNQQWWFRVTPINARAVALFNQPQALSEREFVTVLYAMRNRLVETEVLERLNDYKPPPGTPGDLPTEEALSLPPIETPAPPIVEADTFWRRGEGFTRALSIRSALGWASEKTPHLWQLLEAKPAYKSMADAAIVAALQHAPHNITDEHNAQASVGDLNAGKE